MESPQSNGLQAWLRRIRRNRRSWWRLWRARWRVRLTRPQPPTDALHLPRQTQPARTIRSLRLATLFATLVIIGLVATLALREQQPTAVVAENSPILPRVIIATPSPVPPTATATAVPTATRWATPDPLAGGGTLAFTWEQDGNLDIYLLPVGEDAPLRLTTDPAPDRSPAWRPDGQQIAFSSRRDNNWDIYVYSLLDGSVRRVTHDPAFDGAPAWSPDGRWLVYESYQNDNLDLYITPADGSGSPQRLTRHAALDYAPVWAPDGRHILFVSRRAGEPDLFAVPLDAVGEDTAVNLTNTPDQAEDSPALAPDGSALAYSVARPGGALVQSLPLDEALRPAGPVSALQQQGSQPAWAPDGRALVAVQQQGQQSFLVGGAAAWGVAPQAFGGNGRVGEPDWSAQGITLELAQRLPDAPAAAPTPLFVEARAPAKPDAAPVELFELPVSAPLPYLSDRVDQSFLALRERVQAEVGWDFLGRVDRMYAELDTRPEPGETDLGWHQAGRAFDLVYQDALAFEPRVEVVREDDGQQTTWRVFVRTAVQDGSQGEPLRVVPWDFRARFGDDATAYDAGGKLKDAIPSGYYVDFTALAAEYGWETTPAAANWRTNFSGVLFWHFENRQGLTLLEALAELYDEPESDPLRRAP